MRQFCTDWSWAGLTLGVSANTTRDLSRCQAFVQTTRAKKVLGFFAFQWKENLTLTESQVQALALNRQASQELDVKRREAIYNDVLGKQQMVKYLTFIYLLSVFEWGSCVCSLLNYKCIFRHMNIPHRMVSSVLEFIAWPQWWEKFMKSHSPGFWAEVLCCKVTRHKEKSDSQSSASHLETHLRKCW